VDPPPCWFFFFPFPQVEEEEKKKKRMDRFNMKPSELSSEVTRFKPRLSGTRRGAVYCVLMDDNYDVSFSTTGKKETQSTAIWN